MKFILSIILVTTILIPAVGIVHAQDTYTLLEPLPCLDNTIKCTGNQVTEVSFKDYVQYLFNFLIAACAVAAVFMIVYGGFTYMTSESFQAKNGGLKAVQNAVAGLVLVLSSFLLLRTIDPRLVEIHPTLVKPLGIQYDKKSVAGFFEQVIADANNYQVRNDDFIDQAKQTQAEVKILEDQRDKIQDEISELLFQNAYSYDDPKVQELLAKMQVIDNEIAKKTNSIAKDASKLDINNGGIYETLKNYAQLNDKTIGGLSYKEKRAHFDNGIKIVREKTEKRVKDLTDRGATQEAVEVQDYGRYAILLLQLTREEISTEALGRGSTITPPKKESIDALEKIGPEIKTVQNATLRKELQDKYNKVFEMQGSYWYE